MVLVQQDLNEPSSGNADAFDVIQPMLTVDRNKRLEIADIEADSFVLNDSVIYYY